MPDKGQIQFASETVLKWQDIVDTLAGIINVPVALVVRLQPGCLEVLCANHNERNPYRPGDTIVLDGSHYCEKVIENGRKLCIPNAVSDPQWSSSPALKSGLVAYYGFPLFWPDGKVFGTFCSLDSKENDFQGERDQLMGKFKDLVELHLALIYNDRSLKDTLQALRKVRQASEQYCSEIEKFYKVTLEREERILQLKGEVNVLLKQAGQPQRYCIQKE